MQAASNDLREKLLQQELQNLQSSLERIESLGVPLEMFDSFKKMVKDATAKVTKMVTGKKDIHEVYNHLVKTYGAAGIEIKENAVHLTRNGKQVRVSEEGGKWHVSIDGGQSYEVKDLADLVTQINIRAQDAKHVAARASHLHQVMQGSRAIMLARCGSH